MKTFIYYLILYLVIGFFYNMFGEYNMAVKYANASNKDTSSTHVLSRMLYDPYTYIRSAIFSPVWPVDVYDKIYRGTHK